MPKTANLTITSTTGPGQIVTALVLREIESIKFNFHDCTIEIKHGPTQISYFSYATTATVTYTISGDVATITVA